MRHFPLLFIYLLYLSAAALYYIVHADQYLYNVLIAFEPVCIQLFKFLLQVDSHALISILYFPLSVLK
jgi:hypothetical protein